MLAMYGRNPIQDRFQGEIGTDEDEPVISGGSHKLGRSGWPACDEPCDGFLASGSSLVCHARVMQRHDEIE